MFTPQTLGLTKVAYGLPETQLILSLSRSSVYALVASGKLRRTKCGRKALFLAVDLADFLSALRR